MSAPMMPLYPVYIPTRGRWQTPITASYLIADNVPFTLVVESQEADAYALALPNVPQLILPESNQGLIYARNFIRDHSQAQGHKRHWQLDDNMGPFRRKWKNRRVPCAVGACLRITEQFVDRYLNIGVAGLSYEMFNVGNIPPFYLNVHVYSCTLFLNSLPYRWRTRYNDDTDMCLQVLAGGWCTVLMNAFMAHKRRTMSIKGGNTEQLYTGDGRLKMARSLERLWPGVVSTERRYKRPQHVVKDSWRHFTTPLQRDPTLDWDAIENGDGEFGLTLTQRAPIPSTELQRVVDERLRQQQGGGG